MLKHNLLIIGLIGDYNRLVKKKWNILGPLKYYIDEDLNILYFSIEYKLDMTQNTINLDVKHERFICLSVLLTIYLAHIIIIFIPTSSFDIMYLKRLQIVQYIKHRLRPIIISALTQNVLSTQSGLVGQESIVVKTLTSCINHPRPPRLLFAFTKCTLKLCELEDTIGELDCSAGKAIPEYKHHNIPYILKKTNPLKRLTHVMEDEIYQTLKSASFLAQPDQLITLPNNQEFVFIYPPSRSNYQTTDDYYGDEVGTRSSISCNAPKGMGEKMGADDFYEQTIDPQLNYAFDKLLDSIQTDIGKGNARCHVAPSSSPRDRPPLYDFYPVQNDGSGLGDDFSRFLACQVTTRRHELACMLSRQPSRLNPELSGNRRSDSDDDGTDDVLVHHEFSFYYDEVTSNIIHPKTFSKIVPGGKPLGRMVALNWFNYAKFLLSISSSSDEPALSPKIYGLADEPGKGFEAVLDKFFSRYMDPVTQLSNIICDRAAHLATSYYVGKLPPVCTVEQYNSVVKIALALYYQNARGRGHKIREIGSELESKWFATWYKNRPCEATSLSGYPCLLKFHSYPSNGVGVNQYGVGDLADPLLKMTDDKGTAIPLLNVSEHKSKIKCITSCACGSTMAIRPDPFTAKEGNWDFYEKLRAQCCASKYRIITGRCDDVIHDPENDNSKGVKDKFTEHLRHSPLQILKVMEPQVGDGVDQRSLTVDEGENASESHLIRCFNSGYAMTYSILTPRGPQNKQLTRCDLYPLLLCPKFSSWSLTYYGPLTSYTADSGLDMPNLLPGTNFLLPWYHKIGGEPDEKTIRESIIEPTPPHAINPGIAYHFYCGLEYECPMGHRFIMSGGDPLNQTSQFYETNVGNVSKKQPSANKAMNSDMPIWLACPARNHKKMWAQLTRLYVVVPNTPAKIHLKIAVTIASENHPSPIFPEKQMGPVEILDIQQNSCSLVIKAIESCDKNSIKFYPDIPKDNLILPPNSFWSLKFPYVYCSHLGIHLPDKIGASPTHRHGYLLKNIFDVKI